MAFGPNPNTGGTMGQGRRYSLYTPDGDDAGEIELTWDPQPGDTLTLHGNRSATVTAVLPLALIEEFVSNPVYGTLQVVPLSESMGWR